nr:unnamed protein product [Callosobruchus chinensis]
MWKILCAGSAGRQLKLRNTSSWIVLPCAEEEACIWKLSRRREDRGCTISLKAERQLLGKLNPNPHTEKKAPEIEAATKATRMTRSVRCVEKDNSTQGKANSFTRRRRNPPFRTTLEATEKFTCWRCEQKGHLRVGCHIQVDEMKVNVERSAECTNKMKSMQDTNERVKESRFKEEQEKFTANGDRLEQLLDNQKRRSMDIKIKFDRDTKNLQEKNKQYEAALRKLKEKHDIEVAALKNETKLLEDLDRLMKAERG